MDSLFVPSIRETPQYCTSQAHYGAYMLAEVLRDDFLTVDCITGILSTHVNAKTCFSNARQNSHILASYSVKAHLCILRDEVMYIFLEAVYIVYDIIINLVSMLTMS